MKKVLFFIYGLVTYMIFLPTFLYAIGFITGLVVPKDVDSAALVNLGPPLLINMLLLGLFAIQHSVMARPAFKKWWTKIVPEPIERSTFVLLTCILLISMYVLWQPMTGVLWSVQNGVASWMLTGVSMVGWIIVLLSTFIINHFDLFGLRQVYLALKGKPYTHLVFKKRGFYKYVRHPLMFGFLVAFWATPHMTVGHLVFALLATGYILVALIFEERDLIKFHGENYKTYIREVPKLIPFTKGRKEKNVSSGVPTSLQDYAYRKF